MVVYFFVLLARGRLSVVLIDSAKWRFEATVKG
jgi:hypothetical protein